MSGEHQPSATQALAVAFLSVILAGDLLFVDTATNPHPTRQIKHFK